MREIDHEREKIEKKTEEMREAKRARRAENKRIAREMAEAGEPAPRWSDSERWPSEGDAIRGEEGGETRGGVGKGGL